MLKVSPMRTTLALDDDVMVAARSIADRDRKTIGEVVSDLMRKALQRPAPSEQRNGIALLGISNPNAIVTLDIVNALRDEA